MAEGSWIRIKATEAHLDAKTVNKIIKDALHRKAVSITQKPEIRQTVGECFVDAVTPFVPFKSGDLSRSGAATTDGRVYWTSVHKGYNYANLLYDEYSEVWQGGYIKPTLNKYDGPGTHDPQPRWVARVHPGTPEWAAFVNNVKQIIIEEAQKGNI